MKLKFSNLLLLLLFSSSAYAAPMVAWKSYLFGVMVISLLIGSYLGIKNPKADSRASKLLLTGLYFWVLTFAQLIILALLYYFNKS